MLKTIGIRREDKNKWERRVPLTPAHVKELFDKYGIKTIVQPSAIRIFPDEEYAKVGAEINEDLSEANLVLGIKEIPSHLFQKEKTYMFFAHVIKGQNYNMPMLKRMMELKCDLIEYERVVDEKNRRLIFFGEYAGMTGMIETLHAYAQKLELQGYHTPLSKIKQAYQYNSLEEAKKEIEAIGREIEDNGFPIELCPIVVGFTGYGNVSRGAQAIFNLLPHKTMSADVLSEMHENFTSDNLNFYKVVFSESDMVRPKDPNAKFELQEYFTHPEKYESKFENYLPFINILINGIYWTESYPRFVTKAYLKNESILKSNLPLQVIGDISCDINGAIEITKKATKPDNPTFTYFPQEDRFEEGTQRTGVTVMSVDNLPCEFSDASSTAFSTILKEYIYGIASQNFTKPFSELTMADPIKRALVLHQGQLTENYQYLKEFIHE